jgi:transposase InsO family protein
VKYAFIRASLAGEFPAAAACDALGVSRSGYYDWRDRPASAAAARRAALAAEVRAVHAGHRGVYGSPRVHAALVAKAKAGGGDGGGDGATAAVPCVNTVARVMREHGVRAKTKRPFVPRTTDGAHASPVAGNALARDFAAALPDTKWVADITYVWTAEGWLYVAGVLDLCSRRLVGWSMADHMETSLVAGALGMAVARRCPGAGLLHHSDRGSQYASDAYQGLLAAHGIEVSMSRAGDCWDNACMESFWATLKTELVHHEDYATRAEARASIFEYVEVFYNRKRLHSTLGYVSPEAFEAALN